MMRRFPLLLATAALTGCSMAPKYERPAPPVPPSWPVGDAYLRQTEATLPSLGYRDVFTDARLQQIIAQALANNRDLRVAAANIQQARAQYRIQRAELFPEIDATGRFTRSGNGGGANGSSTSGNAYAANIGTTAFEIDLFGRIRSLTTAAQDRYFGTEAAARATRLTLVGDLADAWLSYAADSSLKKIAEDTAASAQRTVELTAARLRAGVAPRTDLRQAEQTLATAQADVAQQTTAIAQDANAIDLLVGATVDRALLADSIEGAFPTIAKLPAGIDSTILLRRPDVVQAEYELRAANAEIGAARAELFPRISLTSLAGFASTALSSLFTGGAWTYSVAPSATYSIFRAGAAMANVRVSEAQRDAALATYEKSIQSAFREMADALAREGTFDAQLGANRRNVSAASDSFTLSDARYRGGIDPFLTRLVAQRSLYTAQRTLVSIQLVGASNRVTLYRALGGDATLGAQPAP
ncbi:efflux transporter outer membrane subunit [Sphingomonas sp. AP4-R1]|uniref:efflux transporter outer membrane subunit n=1 Tax=Sphingomonas sp. AP4-R1 TaxID=2735134 RepID=UPI0014938123|nr:efflux transporter outer membrane subunit [Sphingomonas sp. AP4-R1]QJU59753.1 efflux transporter outer membrane subunit [Sphingomonas sp. AP4-R1]